VSVVERRRSPPVRSTPTTPTAVVVAGGEVVAARVESMLRRQTALPVTVTTAGELARHIEDHGPAIVVVALESPDAARVLAGLRALTSVDAVLLVTPDPQAAWTADARRSGVRAVLRTDATAEELEAAIAAVRAGLVVLHRDALETSSRRAAARGGSTALTSREHEILEMIAEGLSNRSIAARLGISSQTVKFHVASILAKLGAASRTEAVTFGVRQGLIAL
jgi:DNA-binding NarL/FixJ family response regulator